MYVDLYVFSIHVTSAYHDSTAHSSDARSPHIYFIYSLYVISFICTFYTRRTCIPRLHRRQRKCANSIHTHDIFSLNTFFYIYVLYTSFLYMFYTHIYMFYAHCTCMPRLHCRQQSCAMSTHTIDIFSSYIVIYVYFIHVAPTCQDHGRQLSCANSIHKYGRFSSFISIHMTITYTSHLHAKTRLQTAEVLNLHTYTSNMIFTYFHRYAYNTHIAPACQGSITDSRGALHTKI